MYQEDLKYTKSHEWIKLYKNRVARIGVTDYAADRFGNIQFVDLPEVGSEYDQYDTIAFVEGDKSVSEIDVPLGGNVLAVNEDLDDDPSIINHDPYVDGWMIEIEIAHDRELDDLMDYEQYQEYISKGQDAEE